MKKETIDNIDLATEACDRYEKALRELQYRWGYLKKSTREALQAFEDFEKATKIMDKKDSMYTLRGEDIDLEKIISISDLMTDPEKPDDIYFSVQSKPTGDAVCYSTELISSDNQQLAVRERNELVKAWEGYKYN